MDFDNYGYIYLTTNKINGKIYIGQCTKTPESTEWYLGSGTKIKAAIKKYGKKNFSKKTLCRCGTQLVLDLFEEHFITKFKACNPEIGYNILPGTANKFGSGCPMLIPEIALRVSNNFKGRFKGKENPNWDNRWDEEQRNGLSIKISNLWELGDYDVVRKELSKRMSLRIGDKNHNFQNGENMKGINSPNYGNYWTEEQKQIQSIKRIGKCVGQDNYNFNKTWRLVNNGIKCIKIGLDMEIPEGYKLGMIRKDDYRGDNNPNSKAYKEKKRLIQSSKEQLNQQEAA